MPLKEFTKEQVSQHNKDGDAWMIINDKVYDVSEFLDAHPGGKRVMMPLLGKDASAQFKLYHTAATVLDGKYNKSLMIGKLQGTEDVEQFDAAADTFGSMVAFADPAWYQGWATPYYNDSHKKFRAWMRSFIQKEMMPFVHQWEQAGQVPKSLYKKCGENGLLAAISGIYPFPAQYAPVKTPPGGVSIKEWDGFHNLILGDEMGRIASFGVGAAISLGPSIALPPIYNFGTEEMKKQIIPQVLAGDKTICLAITEPFAGSDVANIQTAAVESADGSHFVINGEKKWITNGTWADYFVLAARTGAAGMGGITLFLLERSMPGLRTRPIQCQGNICSGTAFVILENVKVPKKNIIGSLNKGFKCIMFNFNTERLGICISSIRGARVCLEEALRYANKRRTFGKTLFEHGVIRNKLAHMARQVEASQAWAEYIIYQLSKMDHQEATMKLGGSIALLKAQSTAVFEYCAREASQILGGVSYTRGGVGELVERSYRDVRGAAIPGGSEEIMLDLGIRMANKVSQLYGAKM